MRRNPICGTFFEWLRRAAENSGERIEMRRGTSAKEAVLLLSDGGNLPANGVAVIFQVCGSQKKFSRRAAETRRRAREKKLYIFIYIYYLLMRAARELG
jgi:hypothetical protein